MKNSKSPLSGGNMKRKKMNDDPETENAPLTSILKKRKTEKPSDMNVPNSKSKKPNKKSLNGESPVGMKPKQSLVKSIPSIEKSEGKPPSKDLKKKPFNSKKIDHKKGNSKQNSTISQENKPANKKEARKQQKELRFKRRENEKSYILPHAAKKIFEDMRCNKCPDDRRKELSADLYKVLKGKLVNSARSHELSRMTQWIIKLGTEEVKNSVLEEVIDECVSLTKVKYANHITQCLLQECDKKSRKRLLEKFIGNITVMLRNKFAAPIIEEYYSKYAKNVEKAYIRQELYSDLFRGGRNKTFTDLSSVLTQNPTLKSAILKSTKLILSKLLDKPFALSTNVVSDVLYDYLQNCEDQDKLDILEVLKSNINVLFRTKSGNQVMMLLMWESTPKVKKHMVKELKAQVLKIAKSSGNIFLRSLFDSVDDTVLIKKAILPTILDNAEELVKHNEGKKVILYLVAHRDTTFFHPKELETLKKADESSFVKKDISLKEKELLGPCVEALLEKVKANPEFWFSEGKIALVTNAILSKGTGSKLQEAIDAISSYIISCIEADNFHPIEDAGLHMVLKKLIKSYHNEDNSISFAETFINNCNSEIIDKILSINRGCFLLVLALETNLDSVISHLKDILSKGTISKKLVKLQSSGANILLNLLKEKNIIKA